MGALPAIRVIGSINIDFVTLTPRVPGPGETLSATSMSVHAGGKGANQAVACGKAGFTSPGNQDISVRMIGAVGKGDPYYASLMKPTLEKSGVSTDHIEEIEGVQTGTATIIVDEGSNGENRILFVPGANNKVNDVQKLFKAAIKDGYPDVVVMQGEIPRSAVLELIHLFSCGDHRAAVVFNPAPVFAEGIPLASLKDLAVLVVNETECLLLFEVVPELKGTVELPKPEDLTQSHLNTLTTILHERAAISIILVTLGGRGVYYSANKGKRRDLVPAIHVDEVVDTTAAGDTFIGYFSAALARSQSQSQGLDQFDIKEAVATANAAAAKCVQKSGAMESIPFGYE